MYLVGHEMKLRRLICNVSSFLIMRRPNCDRCNALEDCWGIDMRKRLEELGNQKNGPMLVCAQPGPELRAPSDAFCLESLISSNQEAPTRLAPEDRSELVAKP